MHHEPLDRYQNCGKCNHFPKARSITFMLSAMSRFQPQSDSTQLSHDDVEHSLDQDVMSNDLNEFGEKFLGSYRKAMTTSYLEQPLSQT